MTRDKKNLWTLVFVVVFSCIVMGLVDAVIKPNYAVKSIVKWVVFFILPVVHNYFFKELDLYQLLKAEKKGLWRILLLGVGVYLLIIGGYFIFKDVFDFSNITKSLTENVGVTGNNFVFVALYISFANSFLEEFFFRGYSFIKFKQLTNRKIAYAFSGSMFALYHISMMIGWFSIWLMMIAVVGLFVGGCIFNYINEKYKSIYASWGVHMFANFAINTIGFMLFGLI